MVALVAAAFSFGGARALPGTQSHLVESIPVDARATFPQSTSALASGQAYVLEAVGRYRYNGDMTFPVSSYADAECATNAVMGAPSANLFAAMAPGDDVLDLKVGGALVTWTPAPGTANATVPACSDASIYTLGLTGTGAALSLKINDFGFGFGDNAGVVLVNVYLITGPSDPTLDDTECAAQGMGATTRQGRDASGTSDDLGRGSVCVSDGNSSNGAELYAGGEIGTEGGPYGPMGLTPVCGGIEVAGSQGPGVDPSVERRIFGDNNWGGGNTDAACQ